MIAIVSDAQLRAAVAGIRALGRAGVEVVATGPAGAPGFRSRYVSRHAVVPDAEHEPAAHAAAIAALGAPDAIVYPSSEAGLEALLEHGGDAARLPFPRQAAAALRDKTRLPAAAGSAGLATPRTHAEGTADAIRAAKLPFPFVLKPATAPSPVSTARITGDRDELDRQLSLLGPDDRVLAQELVDGAQASLALLVDRDGTVRGAFQERVVRTWPTPAGLFAITESVAPDAGVVAAAGRLLASSGYYGLAQIDLILTREGPATVIDVNTRLYACLPTALRCGVNLPAAWHALLSGGRVDIPGTYPAGVRYRWLEGELNAAARGHVGRLLTPPRRGTAGAMWARDDKRASAALAWDALRVRLARRVPGR